MNGTDGTASSISTSYGHACAIQAGTGAVVCWGGAAYGQATPPASVDGTAGTASAISAGPYHSCAIQAGSGAVVCWGRNVVGEGTPPPSVDGIAGTASAIAAGVAFSCAIQAGTDAVVCWGSNGAGQATPPPSVDGTAGSASALAAGDDHSCAIQAISGAVVCWGFNGAGQATPPSSVNGTAGTASAIAAGRAHSCAIQAGSGAVVCWGEETYGQATPPASVDGTAGTAQAIAAGRAHSCAIQAGSGAVVCWGEETYGQATPPPSVDGTAGRATQIATASTFSLAIHAPECSDGLDADGDGLVDYPADPGCDSSADFTEKGLGLVCDDGLDNDGDGDVDYPADPGCDSLADSSERGPAFACDDGFDNDGDGLADIPDDPGCDASEDEAETSPSLVCDDAVDNDGDGAVDYPDDRNCTSPLDRSEDPEQCDDGIDNDGDGLVDYPAEPDCTDINDKTERVTPVFEIVHDFGPHHGANPGLTLGTDGNLYGTAGGQVFRIDQAGTYSVYYTSNNTSFVGQMSRRVVVGPDGFLYGFTGQTAYSDTDPETDHGVFFRLDYQGNYTLVATLPHSIATDLLVGSDGAFYGGSAYEYWGDSAINPTGMVKLTTTGEFTALGGNPGVLSPVPQVVGSDGAIYGTRSTQWGNAAQSSVFRLDTAGNFTTIHQMNNTEGFLENFILGSDGFLYATSRGGGNTGHGAVLQMDNTGAVNFLHSFAPADGLSPVGSLAVGGDGAIYGVAQYGGSVAPYGSSGWGTVYRVDSAGTFSVQHSFDWPAEGGFPELGLLLAKDGALYGVVAASVYRIDSAGTVIFPVMPSNFGGASGALVQGSDCGLYGAGSTFDPDTGTSSGMIYRVFEPGHLCQRIEFGSLPDRSLDDSPFSVTASASSGLPVAFSASGSCSISGDQVSLTGTGVCTVTASQAGDSRFGPAEDVVQEFRVGSDGDGEGILDEADNCLEVPNADQADADEDGFGQLCDTDYDQNGVTNVADLNMFRSAYLSGPEDARYRASMDHNSDGVINTLDLGVFKQHFLKLAGPSGLACAGVVPCP